jgi:hypothetical protein
MKNVNNNSNISPERISATTNLKQKNEKLLINQRYNKSKIVIIFRQWQLYFEFTTKSLQQH